VEQLAAILPFYKRTHNASFATIDAMGDKFQGGVIPEGLKKDPADAPAPHPETKDGVLINRSIVRHQARLTGLEYVLYTLDDVRLETPARKCAETIAIAVYEHPGPRKAISGTLHIHQGRKHSFAIIDLFGAPKNFT
jgi:hypothetical protein